MRFTPTKTRQQLTSANFSATYHNPGFITLTKNNNPRNADGCKETTAYRLCCRNDTGLLFHNTNIVNNIENRIRLIRDLERRFNGFRVLTTYGTWDNEPNFAWVKVPAQWRKNRLVASIFLLCLRGGATYNPEQGAEAWLRSGHIPNVADRNHRNIAQQILLRMWNNSTPYIHPDAPTPEDNGRTPLMYNNYIVNFTNTYGRRILQNRVYSIGGIPIDRIRTPSGIPLKYASNNGDGTYTASFM